MAWGTFVYTFAALQGPHLATGPARRAPGQLKRAPGALRGARGACPAALTRWRTPGIHPAYTRHTPGVHPAYTRRTPGIHPACTRDTPGAHPGGSRGLSPGYVRAPRCGSRPRGRHRTPRGGAGPPRGAAEGRPLGVFPQDMRGVCKLCNKLQDLPSDVIRSKIAAFAAFSSSGHPSLSRHFPGDPPRAGGCGGHCSQEAGFPALSFPGSPPGGAETLCFHVLFALSPALGAAAAAEMTWGASRAFVGRCLDPFVHFSASFAAAWSRLDPAWSCLEPFRAVWSALAAACGRLRAVCATCGVCWARNPVVFLPFRTSAGPWRRSGGENDLGRVQSILVQVFGPVCALFRVVCGRLRAREPV